MLRRKCHYCRRIGTAVQKGDPEFPRRPARARWATSGRAFCETKASLGPRGRSGGRPRQGEPASPSSGTASLRRPLPQPRSRAERFREKALGEFPLGQLCFRESLMKSTAPGTPAPSGEITYAAFQSPSRTEPCPLPGETGLSGIRHPRGRALRPPLPPRACPDGRGGALHKGRRDLRPQRREAPRPPPPACDPAPADGE